MPALSTTTPALTAATPNATPARSIVFKYAELTDLPEIQEKMNRSQKATFVVDTQLFTILLFVAVLLSLIHI